MPSLSAIIGSLSEEQNLPLYQQLQRRLRRAIEMKLLAPEASSRWPAGAPAAVAGKAAGFAPRGGAQ